MPGLQQVLAANSLNTRRGSVQRGLVLLEPAVPEIYVGQRGAQAVLGDGTSHFLVHAVAHASLQGGHVFAADGEPRLASYSDDLIHAPHAKMADGSIQILQ